MPTYSYACTACGHRFDARQAFTDDALTDCPQCAGRLRKVFGAVGVVFKGSGFYRNDARAATNGGSKDRAGTDSDAKAGGTAGSEAKAGSDTGAASGSTGTDAAGGSGSTGSSGSTDRSRGAGSTPASSKPATAAAAASSTPAGSGGKAR